MVRYQSGSLIAERAVYYKEMKLFVLLLKCKIAITGPLGLSTNSGSLASAGHFCLKSSNATFTSTIYQSLEERSILRKRFSVT